MTTATLTCSCGMTLNAAGAKPGRVGKCPKCGALLTVPDDFGAVAPPTSEPAGYGVDPANEARPTYREGPARETASPRTSNRQANIPVDHGPVRPPKSLEKRFGQSLGYPLWCWSSVAMLFFMPPCLAFVSSPFAFVFALLFAGTGFNVAGLLLLVPMMLAGICVWGYTLVFLGHVLTSSAFGEALPPRMPNVQDEGVFRVLGRWFWAIVAGFGLGFFPAVAYWINCGEVDWIDRLMFANLSAIGAAYAQMALLAALLHDDPLAANPITVGRGIVRIGWDYAGICLLSGAFLAGMTLLFGLLTLANGSAWIPVLSWLYWLVFLYGATVVLRRLGLFCHRHRVILAWFGDRSISGRR